MGLGRLSRDRCTLVHRMERVEWDRSKARSNMLKHGVAFADAAAVFEDPRALSMRDDRHDEERWVTIGMDPLARLLVAVYTWRGSRVRLISARVATAWEVRQYEEGL